MAAKIILTFSQKGLDNDQVYDVGRRITARFLDPVNGLPVTDLTTRELAADAAETVKNLGARLAMDRKNKWTERRKKFDADRDKYVSGIRRGVKTILDDPDENLALAKRDGAALLKGIFGKRVPQFEKKATAENNGELSRFFADCDTTEAQAALQATDLLRLYVPLKKANTAYEEALSNLGITTTEAGGTVADEPVETPPAQPLPELRVVKQLVTEDVRLILQIAARFAKKGKQPYVDLTNHSSAILAELASTTKSRGTREKKKKEAAVADGIAS